MDKVYRQGEVEDEFGTGDEKENKYDAAIC
jgi:hypothetical protein